MVTLFYVMMAFFGYFSTIGRTKDIVILRESIPGYTTDYFMMVGKVAVMMVMVVNIVTNYMPFRNNLYQMLFDTDEFSRKANLLITSIFFLFVVLISIIFPKVTSILGIFGGLTSTLICYTIPCN